MARPVALVVDDEPDIRELLAMTLERMDIETSTCGDVATARDRLARREFQLCLTDMRLPDGTGLDLVREVAQSAGPPIAVITAYGSAENAVAALKAGAFDYLTKPVDVEQLRMLVRSAVRVGAAGEVDASDLPALARLTLTAPARRLRRLPPDARADGVTSLRGRGREEGRAAPSPRGQRAASGRRCGE